ncbi:MAG TPA: ATP-binding protein [Myxococcota bacterium]|nr:ATP-binding protein [Myxococcota bacterium]
MTAAPGESALARRPALGDIFDPQAIAELCQSYADLYGIAIKIFDAENRKLVDTRGALDVCRFIFDYHGTKVRCTNLVSDLKRARPEVGQGTQTVNCFTGLRYRVAPLEYEGDVLGKVIFGPYLPVEWRGAPADLVALDPGIEAASAQVHYEKLRRVRPETVEKIISQMVLVLGVMIHTGYRMQLTAQTHIDSISAAFQEQNRQTLKLQESYEKLKELDRLKSNFLATVSHELRTPLTSVIGYSEMLLDGLAGDLNTEQREYVRTIMEKGETLLKLITSLLDLSRIESGGLRLQRERFAVGPLLEDVVSTLLPQAQRKGVNLITHAMAGLPPLNADREKVRQVLVNLASNAVKFTPGGGKVELLAEAGTEARLPGMSLDRAQELFEPRDRRVMRLRVVDTGIGIPRHEVPKIFDSFYQVDSGSTREYGGAGLGLSIARSFVVAHSGRIDVETAPGRGSTFTVTVPVDPE